MKRSLSVRFWKKVSRAGDGECWLWKGAQNGHGYGSIARRGDAKPYMGAHRASWILHRGAIPRGMCVLHKCDVPLCVNPAHLFLGSLAENTKDMIAKRRHASGEKIGTSKLTWQQVAEIRASKDTLRELAAKYGVTYQNVYLIRKGQTWRKRV